VIVGGGAGGLPLATALGDKLGRPRKAEITLVDRFETHVWKPLLHEIAAGRMDADAHGIDYLALAHWHRFRFRQGAVIGLDRARHELMLDAVHDTDGTEILPKRIVGYDTLVVCVGSVSADFGVVGVTEHTIALDTQGEAEHFHRKLIAACTRADALSGQGRHTSVNIVIIGAGATGGELAAEIRQTTREHAGYGLENLDPVRDVRLTIVEAAPRILPQLPERISAAALDLLAKLDIQVLVNEPVSEVSAEGVRTQSGKLLAA
jgi:NADH dehydrogenase